MAADYGPLLLHCVSVVAAGQRDDRPANDSSNY